jgi:hypothetical protein
MKKVMRFWSYFAQFFFKLEMFQTKIVETRKSQFYDQ